MNLIHMQCSMGIYYISTQYMIQLLENSLLFGECWLSSVSLIRFELKNRERIPSG